MTIEEIRNKTIPILRAYEVEYAGVFGSAARGEVKSDSDVDILVRFKKIPSLVKFIRLEDELKTALKREVDVVVQGSEKPFVRYSIQKDLVAMYGQR